MLNASRRFDADEIWDLVERESVMRDLPRRRRDGAPARRRARARDRVPTSLFAIVSGGAILSPAIKAEINERAAERRW